MNAVTGVLIYFSQCFFASTFAILISPFAVLIGLPFARENQSRVQRFTKHVSPTAFKRHIDLPDWLLWFQNREDGMTGDARGWYWNLYFPDWVPDWFKMWWWSGIRNPANCLKRNILGVDVRDITVEKVRGDDFVRDDFDNTGFQILRGVDESGEAQVWALYWVRRWGESNRAIVVQLGAKIKLDHNGVEYDDERDYLKGITFEVNPVKDIS